MESEPLVNASNRKMNYTCSEEDGSSILNQGLDITSDDLNGGTGAQADNKADCGPNCGNGRSDYTLLERFHEDALQQVNF